MKQQKITTVYCFLPTASCLLLTAVYCFLPAVPALAQEISPESLRLPEVVITGVDQSKLQRQLSRVVLQSALPEVVQSSRDRSDQLVQEGDVLYLTYPEQAEKLYVRARTLDPANSRTYLRLGDVYRILRRYTAAIDAYQKALEVSTNIPEAHYKLGILYESQPGETQKAIEHYRTYLQLGGSDPRVRIWLRNAEREKSS